MTDEETAQVLQRVIEPIADVSFQVWFDGDNWVAVSSDLHLGAEDWSTRGEGSTPITALMVAEAKARKAAK